MDKWEHYQEYPFEVVTLRSNNEGAVISQHLHSRHSMYNEALHARTVSNNGIKKAGNEERYHTVIQEPFTQRAKEKAYIIDYENLSTHYTYMPERPFRLTSLLVWEGKGKLNELIIGNIQQIYSPVSLAQLEAPFPIEHAKSCIELNMLTEYLPHKYHELCFHTCDIGSRTTLSISGTFKHIMAWGIELTQRLSY